MSAIDNEELLDKLKKTIKKNQTLNGNKCGTSAIFLIEELNIDFKELKILLNTLQEKKLIRIREGINQKLIFLRV
jgi:hypothetical protein